MLTASYLNKILSVGLVVHALITSQTRVAAQEAPQRPSAQALKAGVRVFEQPEGVISYERQFSPRWSLHGSIGFFPQKYTTYGIWYSTPSGQQQPETVHGLNSIYHVDAQVRYYLRRRKPQPALCGWYGAVVLQGSYIRTREEHEATPTTGAYTTRSITTRLQPQVHIGRQWALGQRLLLDTFVGTEVFRRATTQANRNRYYPLNRGVGVQMGLRL